MIIPPHLKAGDTVGLVATASYITESAVMAAIESLKEHGLHWKLSPNLYAQYGMFAGNDEQRLSDLQGMIDDPMVKAVWNVRGGYGTVRLLDNVNFKPLTKNPKWFVGYSDVTGLHSHLHACYNLCTIHGTMGVSIPKNTEDAKSTLISALFGKNYSIACSSLSSYNRNGEISAPVVGGNLSLLYSMLGSNSSIVTDGKILFIEDIDEALYHLDRMLLNLKRNGYFENLAGFIIGGMTDMREGSVPFGKPYEEIIKEYTLGKNYPVLFDFPAGHIKDNRALVLGKTATLKVSNSEAKLDFVF